MEPVTHFLTGANLGRTGFNRRVAYVVLAMTLGAEAPDLDILWQAAGPTAGLEHHRGWTHTLLGAPMMATAVLVAIWLWHRWCSRKGTRENAEPVNWAWVWVCALIADLSHIFLDYTNNYGVRPFAPFNPRWYAGSFVFIFEPLIFLALVMGLVAPWVLGLRNQGLTNKRRNVTNRNWAIGTLIFIALLWSYRAEQHHLAVADLMRQSWDGPVVKISANPYPITPWMWHGVVETPTAFVAAIVDTGSGRVVRDAAFGTKNKLAATPAIKAAEASHFGRVFLDWSKLPYVEDLGRVPLPGSPNEMSTAVRFTDLRFEYGVNWTKPPRDDANPPLSAVVYVDDNLHPVLVQMGKSQEKP
jgi:inner membrane protein